MENAQEIKNLILSGKNVYYGSLLYICKIDFDGDLLLKCVSNSSQQLIDNTFDFKLFFTK
jgi:hypothetical protein